MFNIRPCSTEYAVYILAKYFTECLVQLWYWRKIDYYCSAQNSVALIIDIQQQPFYCPLIQDNPGELVPETVGHIDPHYHHYPPQYL